MVKDKIIMMLAFTYCNVWHKLRCRAFRRIDDFNYHVFTIGKIPNSKFFMKKVEVNNDFEKTVSVKIGNVCVRYSVDKTIKNGDVLDADIKPDWIIKRAVGSDTITKPHHEAKIINMKGEARDVTARDSNS